MHPSQNIFVSFNRFKLSTIKTAEMFELSSVFFTPVEFSSLISIAFNMTQIHVVRRLVDAKLAYLLTQDKSEERSLTPDILSIFIDIGLLKVQ